jgi:acetoin utilization deacetylase AcuC-like enzyme
MSRSLHLFAQPSGRHELPFLRDQSGAITPGIETDERMARIARGLIEAGADTVASWAGADPAELDRVLHRVHATSYLEFLAAWDEQSVAEAVFAEHRFVQAGVQPDTPLMRGMYALASNAAGIAIAAATHAMVNKGTTYALTRPPGHHAGPEFLGGYCYLNNAAIAAMHLRTSGLRRVGVIDFDFHIGNGTSVALASEPGTYFGSVHASTITSYPYLPIEPANERQRFRAFDAPPTAAEWLAAVEELARDCVDFSADAIVVSVGYDPVRGDPHGGWTLEPEVFADVGRMLAATKRPLCMVQEGGYALEMLPSCAYQFARGLLA